MATDQDRTDAARMSRRTALGWGGAAIAAAAVAGTGTPAGATPSGRIGPVLGSAATTAGKVDPAAAVERLVPTIRPRSDWGADLPPTGPIAAEEDVRFLLVHHTASNNDYGPDQVVDQIRGFYEFHTGPEKLWPDVAYNFFVDRFGGIWEARAGSLAGAVRGDATGGSQGFAMLCSLIGNHAEAPVTAEAQASLTALLAWLAERHGIDTAPGTSVEFVSRGSSRWPEGETVTARTISGHREMSTTACPGDFAFDLLDTIVPEEVGRLRAAALGPVTTTEPSSAAETTTASTAPPATPPPTEPTPGSTGDDVAAPTTDGGGGRLRGGLTALVAAGAAALAAVAVRVGSRLQR